MEESIIQNKSYKFALRVINYIYFLEMKERVSVIKTNIIKRDSNWC